MFDLTGKAALVTGAGRGIGRGIALALAQRGCDVVVNDLDHGQAEQVAEEVQGLRRRSMAVDGDVSRSSGARHIVAEAQRALGRLDILVNNAGILTYEPFLELREETWDRTLAVNLKGQFLVAQAAARGMVASGRGGRIVNLASIASGQVGVGFPGTAHYTASKGGVIALTQTMAVELGRHRITVNAIAPGPVDSEMTRDLLDDPKAKDGLLQRIPVGRVGQPEDVGALAVFLASDEASFCSGATFYVDGGWLAGG